MAVNIDDKVLECLVKYESVVKKQISAVEDRLWIELDFNSIRKFDEMSKLIGEISSMVDLAFRIYGETSGFMKIKKEMVDSSQLEKLNSLVRKISKINISRIGFEKVLQRAV